MTWTFFRSGGTRHSGGLRPMSLADNMLWQDVVTREGHFAPFSFYRGIPQGSVQRLLYFKIEFLFTGSKTTRPGHVNAVICCWCRHPFFPSLMLISGMLFSLIFGLWAQLISPTSTCHVATAARSYKKTPNKHVIVCLRELSAVPILLTYISLFWIRNSHAGDLIQLKQIKVEATGNPGFSFNIPDEPIKFILYRISLATNLKLTAIN